MINFMGQHDWAKDIKKADGRLFLDLSGLMFLEEYLHQWTIKYTHPHR